MLLGRSAFHVFDAWACGFGRQEVSEIVPCCCIDCPGKKDHHFDREKAEGVG